MGWSYVCVCSTSKNCILTLSTSRFVSVESLRTKLDIQMDHIPFIDPRQRFQYFIFICHLFVDATVYAPHSMFNIHCSLFTLICRLERGILKNRYNACSLMFWSLKATKRFRKDRMSLKSTVYEPTLPITFDIVCILHFLFSRLIFIWIVLMK